MIIQRQKEFNSKSQKALRRAIELKKGLGNPANPYSHAASLERMAEYPGVVKQIKAEAIHLGRRANKNIIDPARKNIHDRINYRDQAKKFNNSGAFNFKLSENL